MPLQATSRRVLPRNCDDLDASTYPGAPELCDGTDNDCIEEANFGGTAGSENDDDGDGVAECEGDCNDSDIATFPGAIEDCGLGDLNCDGDPVAGAVGGDTWYADLDGDGYGGSTLTFVSCTQPPGYVEASLNGDCNDLQPIVYPGAAELCDGIDNDCDPTTVSGGTADRENDGDGDGQRPCGGDCDDADDANYLGNTELCDGQDNDCNNAADVEGAGSESDDDSDSISECQGDCDDTPVTGATIFPGAGESCDSIDSDCNGSLVDSFADFDGDLDPDCIDLDDDGDGDADSSDCDDANSNVFSGAPEICDEVDADCDGLLVDSGTDNCASNATCTNNGSSHSCECDSGYQGTGTSSCTPIGPFNGSVLLNSSQEQQLNTWVGSPGQVWTLCYRKTTHGGSSSAFLSQCDSYSNTITIAQMNNGNLMGGYAGLSWSAGCYNSGSSNFLFSLTNGQRWNCTTSQYCGCANSSYGPTFGGGHDWHVSSDMTTGYCNAGHSYSGANSNSLCGSYDSWSITEMEVWYR